MPYLSADMQVADVCMFASFLPEMCVKVVHALKKQYLPDMPLFAHAAL